MGMRHFNRSISALSGSTRKRRFAGKTVCTLAMLTALLPGAAFAQAHPAAPTASAAASRNAAADAPATGSVTNERELGATQEQLMSLLRVTPTLAEVVAADPLLLSNEEYVGRSNPELAAFLHVHPEIARNPGFYLFSELRGPEQRHYSVLEPKHGFTPREDSESGMHYLVRELSPIVVTIFIVGALLWLIRLLLENRRWGRAFKTQAEVHGRLIEKFASSQEMLAYMETDAGKRFLEAAPIATEVPQQRIPNLVARVIATLQIGVVLTLLGVGLVFMRHSVPGGAAAMLVLGTIVLMPGVGFMISAGITWVLARRLGLIEDRGRNAAALREQL